LGRDFTDREKETPSFRAKRGIPPGFGKLKEGFLASLGMTVSWIFGSAGIRELRLDGYTSIGSLIAYRADI
jgi:hypothetical protein